MAKLPIPHHGKLFSALLIVAIFALLVLHTFFDHLHIDNTTVFLLLLIILIPYLPWITRIKFGDFEAEIGRKEIEQIGDKLDASQQQPTPNSTMGEELENIREQGQQDPQVALLKVRVAIEKRLRALLSVYLPGKEDTKFYSAGPMVWELRQADVLDEQLAGALEDVISVANRAVHGENITTQNAESIIDISLRAIRSLDTLLFDKALSSMKTKVIKPEIAKGRQEATYQVITTVPYVDSPEERTYIMNQAELDAFLESYSDYAEFLVSVQSVSPPKRPKGQSEQNR
jgi:hypothetical protein